MAELICDFDAVKQVGQQLIDSSSDFDSAISTFSSTIDSDLSGWEGSTKNSFNSQVEGQVQASKQASELTKATGEYIKTSAEAIEALEEELASKSI